jgi:hypothetical protein
MFSVLEKCHQAQFLVFLWSAACIPDHYPNFNHCEHYISLQMASNEKEGGRQQTA